MTAKNDNDITDILWGAAAIGKAIGVNKRRAFYLLENGDIPAKRVGARWCCSRSQLAAFFRCDLPPKAAR